MDPLRFNAVRTPGIPTPGIPGAAAQPQAAPQTPAAAGDQVSIGSNKRSLLDKAKNISMLSAGGLIGSGLLYAGGAIGLATAIGAGAGLVALAATGMAAIHFGKKLFHRPQVAEQQTAGSSNLISKAKNFALGSSVGIATAGVLSAAGVTAGVSALGAIAGGAAVIALGMGAVHLAAGALGKRGGQTAEPQAPPQQVPAPQAPPPEALLAQPPGAAEVTRAQGVPAPPVFR